MNEDGYYPDLIIQRFNIIIIFLIQRNDLGGKLLEGNIIIKTNISDVIRPQHRRTTLCEKVINQ